MNASHAGRILTAMILLLAWANLSSVQARQDIIKREFAVQPGGTLFLDIDMGSIDVRTHSGSDVRLVLERDVDDGTAEDRKELLSRHEFRAEREGHDVIVELFIEDEEDGIWRRWKRGRNLQIHFEITVPTQYNIEFRSGAGNVEIADLRGRVEGRTGAGNVELGHISGDVDITSGAGDIHVEGAMGNVSVQSGAGNISLDDVRGEVRVRTGAGNIDATITEALEGESTFGTGAGNVTVTLGDEIGADVEAKASMGSAKTDYDLRVQGSFMSKSFSGRVNGGGPVITMSAGVGNVTLLRR